ncbi:MAG: sugar ABC transporter substrate-binding protein [Mycoplasmatales bacterium]
MKKLMFILVFGAVILAGCGSTNSEEVDKLVVWAMGDEGNHLSELTDKYQEETGIEVEVVAIPWDQAHDKLSTAVASKSGPDVIQLGTSWITEYAESGALADLSEFSEDQFDSSLYFEGAADTMAVDGTTYSIPWYVDARALYYRTDIIKETCGLDAAPTTWDEMFECSNKLADRGDDQYGVAFDISDQFFFVQYAWQNGWDVLDENGKINVQDEKFIEAMEYTQSFIKSGATTLDMADIDITQTFSDGRFPFFFSGPWSVNVLLEANPELEDKFSIAPVPAGDAGSVAYMGGSNLAIFEYSENKEAAADLINWMVTPKQQTDWYDIAKSLPAQKSVWEDQEFLDSGFEMDVWNEILKNAKPVPMLSNWEEVAQKIVDAQENVIAVEEDPAEVAEELQGEIDELMDK